MKRHMVGIHIISNMYVFLIYLRVVFYCAIFTLV